MSRGFLRSLLEMFCLALVALALAWSWSLPWSWWYLALAVAASLGVTVCREDEISEARRVKEWEMRAAFERFRSAFPDEQEATPAPEVIVLEAPSGSRSWFAVEDLVAVTALPDGKLYSVHLAGGITLTTTGDCKALVDAMLRRNE